MTPRIILIAALGLLAGCASAPTTSGNRPAQGSAQFVMAGPTNADADVVSMRWRYSLQWNSSPSGVSEIKFGCYPIPGTVFAVKGEAIKPGKNNISSFDGPVLPVTKEATPWLLEKTNTNALCQAIIVRPGQKDEFVQASVSFSPSNKAATVDAMRTAQEFNSKLDGKKK